MLDNRELHQRRKERIRYQLRQVNAENRPRLSVHRTNLHIYAQITDDAKGVTLASASSMTEAYKKSSKLKNGGNKAGARTVGELIAKAAKEKGISEVVFDRSGYLYHGRIKELADAAREAGLKF